MTSDHRELLYFAFGSNMSTPRLRSRVPSARPLGAATLPGHVLRFHKPGRDGSAKCDACYTGRDSDAVHGVVFALGTHEKPYLDTCEGLGNGYAEKTVTVTDARGTAYRVYTYYATRIDPGLRPYHWYKTHVLRGALEHRLPEHYIAAIRGIASIDDPSCGNHLHELSIYGI